MMKQFRLALRYFQQNPETFLQSQFQFRRHSISILAVGAP